LRHCLAAIWDTERERKRQEKESGEVVRDTSLEGGSTFHVLKVPRQYPLVLLVEVMHMFGINVFITLEGLHFGEI
jgi:hypothetical protein